MTKRICEGQTPPKLWYVASEPPCARCPPTKIERFVTRLCPTANRLQLYSIIADDDLVVAIVSWSSSYRGEVMEGKEAAVYRIRGSKIAEAWFHPADKAVSDKFFE